MYGRIGKIAFQPGQRDTLIPHLLAGTQEMSGCRSYVVATDAARSSIVGFGYSFAVTPVGGVGI